MGTSDCADNNEKQEEELFKVGIERGRVLDQLRGDYVTEEGVCEAAFPNLVMICFETNNGALLVVFEWSRRRRKFLSVVA